MYANETINEKQRIKIIHNKAFLKKIHRTMCDEKRYEKETCNPFSKAGATKEFEKLQHLAIPKLMKHLKLTPNSIAKVPPLINSVILRHKNYKKEAKD